jgi:hypothetical protein
MGGESYFSMGATAKDTRARALIEFDLKQVALPAHSVITNVTIHFNLPSLNRPDTTAVDYEFYLMNVNWGEGTKLGNTGSPATAGEATWNQRSVPTSWTAPGAVQGSDYEPFPSGHGNLGPAPGQYTIPSTLGLIRDVQLWIAQPDRNFAGSEKQWMNRFSNPQNDFRHVKVGSRRCYKSITQFWTTLLLRIMNTGQEEYSFSGAEGCRRTK